MTDIVERLRLWQVDNWKDPVHKDAADEIERLRKELTFLHTELDKLRRIMDEPP